MAIKLTILGSSAAIPTESRNLSAQLLEHNGVGYLFDCGEATQFQLLKFKKKLNKINHIFISHLHGDHYYGIFGLLSTMSMQERQHPLNLYAPASLLNLIQNILEIENRKLRFDLIFTALNFKENQIIFQSNDVIIQSFPLEHSIECSGFRFNEVCNERNINKDFVAKNELQISDFEWIKNGNDYVDLNGKIFKNNEITSIKKENSSFAYCSDTKFSTALVQYIKAVKVLYHEATFLNIDKDKAEEKMHSTLTQAIEIAELAEVNQLIVGHFSQRYKDFALIEKEAEQSKVVVILAQDGLEINF